MHKTMDDMKDLCELKKMVEGYFVSFVKSGNSDAINPATAGEWIDMIKDLWESEKNAWKACYYRKLVEGMEPMDEEMHKKYKEGPFGYDNWRYASGQFAPTGRGHRSGYVMKPDLDIYPPNMMDVYGYSDGDANRMTHDPDMERYGKAYKQWKDSRRHYTESNSQKDKEDMDLHAKEHMTDAMASLKELWKHGDPELRKEIKKNLTALVGEMPA